MKHPALLPFVLLLAAAGPAQDLPLSPALERAIAADELEHDVPRARELLRAVAEDAAQPEPVRRHAWLRLARLQRRLGEDAADALARAAVGEDAVALAARELQGQGKGDIEREAELQEKARVAVEAAIQNGQFADAVWFGAAAVPAAIRAFEERLGRPTEPAPAGPTGPGGLNTPPQGLERVLTMQREQLRRSAGLLWHLPGEAAGRFLAEGLGSEQVARRRALASGIQHLQRIPGERLGVIRQALRDADAEVVANALEAGQLLPLADLLPFTTDARDAVRLRGLQQLANWAPRFNRAAITAELRADSEAIAAVLPRLLASTSPQEHRLALQVAGMSSLFSRAGRKALVGQLMAVHDGQAYQLTLPRTGIDDWEGGAENASALREVLVRLGPWHGNPRASQHFAMELVQLYVSESWDRGALDPVLTAWRLGYDHPRTDWIQRHLRDEDAGAVVAGLADNSDALRQASPWLSQRAVPDEAFPILRAALSSAPEWKYDDALLVAIARTGHPEAATTILEFRRRGPDSEPVVLHALNWLAAGRRDAPARDALRGALLAMEPRPAGTAVSNVTDNHVAQAIGTLIHLGDREILAHLDRFPALRQGGVLSSVSHGEVHVRTLPVGRDWPEDHRVGSPRWWLVIACQLPDGTRRWWHGYSAEDYREIWQRMLAPVEGRHDESAWRLVEYALEPLPSAPASDPILVQIVADAAHRRVRTDEEIPYLGVLYTLLHAADKGTLPDTMRSRVEELHDAAFSSREDDVREMAIRSLFFDGTPPSLDRADRARLLQALVDPSAQVRRAAQDGFKSGYLPIDREVVEQALRAEQASRQEAFELLRRVRDDVPDLLRGLVKDPDESVRHAACVELGQSLRLDAVPALLEALKDPAAKVREAATQSLQAIRFYHDEKAHWDQVFAGRAGLTAASAAGALLEQAKPGNDRATRVLAIRSLGVLGAPETQPFLIEWTRDADAEVAAAAREAVGRIHAGKGR